MAPASPADGPPGTTFQPINPDGSLVDCVPPPCLSPTGPIAYLQQLLTLTELSSCADPAGPRSPGARSDRLRRATVLAFPATAGVRPGLSVNGSGVQDGTTVSAVSPATATVTVTPGLSGEAPAGTAVTSPRPRWARC